MIKALGSFFKLASWIIWLIVGWIAFILIGVLWQYTTWIMLQTGFSFYVANSLAIFSIIAVIVIFYNLYKIIKTFLENN